MYIAAALKAGFACPTASASSAAADHHGAVAGTAADTLATGAVSFCASAHAPPAAPVSFPTASGASSLLPPASCRTASDTSPTAAVGDANAAEAVGLAIAAGCPTAPDSPSAPQLKAEQPANVIGADR